MYDGQYATGGVDAAHLEGVPSDNMKTKAAVVNGLASAHAAAVVEAVVEVGDAGATAGASGTSSASGGSESTGIPSTHWPADRASNAIGWKLGRLFAVLSGRGFGCRRV